MVRIRNISMIIYIRYSFELHFRCMSPYKATIYVNGKNS
nr:MAG TPA: hypothetical protein [Caudoviricetes sp.]